MSYGDFAYLYDRLMDDVNYDQWLEFIHHKVDQYSDGRKMSHILDLACGTGELSVKLATAGFEVVGIDLSEDMLTVANGKAQSANQRIVLYQQDMTELEGLPTFDLIIIFCDSLNYLQSAEDVKKTFQHVYQFLNDDGIFMFDVHSIYKMEHLFMDQTYVSTDDDISYIWNSFPGEHDHSVEHELTFFVKHEHHDDYQRFDELHFQRTFSVEQYKEWLADCGFVVVDLDGDFDQTINEQTERIFFTVKKGTV